MSQTAPLISSSCLAAPPDPLPDLKQDWREVDMEGKEYEGVDFSGQDLSRKRLCGTNFSRCDFTRADLGYANAEGATFAFSKLVRCNLYRLNLKDGSLSWCDFRPSDSFGITLTMECKTFEHCRMGRIWWLGLTYFFTTIQVVDDDTDLGLVQKLIGGVFGAERYIKLRAIFQRREL